MAINGCDELIRWKKKSFVPFARVPFEPPFSNLSDYDYDWAFLWNDGLTIRELERCVGKKRGMEDFFRVSGNCAPQKNKTYLVTSPPPEWFFFPCCLGLFGFSFLRRGMGFR